MGEAEVEWEPAEWAGGEEGAAEWPVAVDEDEAEAPSAALPEEEYTEEDISLVEERLKNLGYL